MAHIPQQNNGGGQNDLTTWIRNYVHYSNLLKNYTQQASGARKLRDEFEGMIINHLRTNRMENAIIQTTDSRLQCVEEKSMPSLCFPLLEKYLHMYYKQKGNGLDETESLLKFIKIQKQNDAQPVVRLKKTPTPVAIPPPPPAIRPNQLMQ